MSRAPAKEAKTATIILRIQIAIHNTTRASSSTTQSNMISTASIVNAVTGSGLVKAAIEIAKKLNQIQEVRIELLMKSFKAQIMQFS